MDSEVKSVEELTVGLPKDNLTILELARRFAAAIHRDTLSPDDARTRLRSLIRYQPVAVEQAWMVDSTKNKGVESRSYQLLFNNGLSSAAVWFKSMTAPENAPITIMINDEGRKTLSADVSERVNRGAQVLAVDLLFTGDEKPQRPAPFAYALLLTSVGERPIGMEAAQLIAAAQWLSHKAGVPGARMEAVGPRSQLAALVAAAVAPGLFSEVTVRKGLASMASLFSTPVKFRDAPDLFCLDLYKVFDIDTIANLTQNQ